MINLNKNNQTVTEQKAREAITTSLYDDALSYTMTFLKKHNKSNTITASFIHNRFSLDNSNNVDKVAKRKLLNPKLQYDDIITVKRFLSNYAIGLSVTDLLDIAMLNSKYNMQTTLRQWILTNYLDLSTKYNISINSVGIKPKELATELLLQYDMDHHLFNNVMSCQAILNTYRQRACTSIEEKTMINLICKSFFQRTLDDNYYLLPKLFSLLKYKRKSLDQFTFNLPINLLMKIIDEYSSINKTTIPIRLVASSAQDVDNIINYLLAAVDNSDGLFNELTNITEKGVTFDTSKVKETVEKWRKVLNGEPFNQLSTIAELNRSFALIFD